jgi:hypothetical protein
MDGDYIGVPDINIDDSLDSVDDINFMRVEIAVLPMINIRSYCDQATLITLVLMQ